MPEFHVVSEYSPAGDQPQAIEKLAEGVAAGLDEQTLLGVTGSGKTYTMAKVIERVQKPTLVLAHNKTLAAQLCSEFKEFFPDNAVEYFVSYYDYYQPEAYIPHLRSRRAGRFCAHGYLSPPRQQSAAGGAFKKTHRLPV